MVAKSPSFHVANDYTLAYDNVFSQSHHSDLNLSVSWYHISLPFTTRAQLLQGWSFKFYVF